GAVEQHQAERHQRVDAADAGSADQHLEQIAEVAHSGHDFQKRLIFSQRPYSPAGSTIMIRITTAPNTSCDQARKVERKTSRPVMKPAPSSAPGRKPSPPTMVMSRNLIESS